MEDIFLNNHLGPINNPDNHWIDILLALATFLAVIVALFQERIRIYWNKSILDMEINLEKPDSHQIALLDKDGNILRRTFYIRIKVSHRSGSAGENVEIIPLNFWRKNKNGSMSKVEYFLPINLVWSHFQPRTNTIRVPVGSFRHCDFGYFVKDMRRGYPQSLLILDTIVQPGPVSGGEVPNVIGQGKFQFELLLSGDNIKPICKKWEIEFDKWSDNEDEMLNDIVKIRAI